MPFLNEAVVRYAKPTTKAGKQARKAYFKENRAQRGSNRAQRAGKKVKNAFHDATSRKARYKSGERMGGLGMTDRLEQGEGINQSAGAGWVAGGSAGLLAGTAATKPKHKKPEIYKGLKAPRLRRVHKITDMGSPKEKHEHQMRGRWPDFRPKVFAGTAAAGGAVGFAIPHANPQRESRMKKKPVSKREKFGYSSEEARGRVTQTAKTRNMYASKKNKGHRAKNWKTLGTHTGVGAGVGAAAGGLLARRSGVGAGLGAGLGGAAGADIGIVTGSTKNAYRNTTNAIKEGKRRGDVVSLNGKKADWKGVVKKSDPFEISKDITVKSKRGKGKSKYAVRRYDTKSGDRIHHAVSSYQREVSLGRSPGDAASHAASSAANLPARQFHLERTSGRPRPFKGPKAAGVAYHDKKKAPKAMRAKKASKEEMKADRKENTIVGGIAGGLTGGVTGAYAGGLTRGYKGAAVGGVGGAVGGAAAGAAGGAAIRPNTHKLVKKNAPFGVVHS